jgi:hypothetical protein
MKSTLKRLGAVAALGAMGILAPVASASAATPVLPAGLTLPAGFTLPAASLPTLPTGFQFPVGGLPAFNPAGLAFTGPSVGQIAAVIGPTVITTAPSTFNNTNIQTSAGGNGLGGQAGPG